MLNALFNTLGKATQRLLGKREEGAERSEARSEQPLEAPTEGVLSAGQREAEGSAPEGLERPAVDDPFTQLEDDLERDLQGLMSPRRRSNQVSRAAPRRPVQTSLSPATPSAVEAEPQAFEASFALSERAPSASALFEGARQPTQAITPRTFKPPTRRGPREITEGSVVRRGPPTPKSSDDPRVSQAPVRVTPSAPQPTPVIDQRPSATKVTSSSRVLRPDEPPSVASPELSAPSRRRRSRGGDLLEAKWSVPPGAMPPPEAPAPKPRAPRTGYAKRPPRAQASAPSREGFQEAGAFNLRNMSSSQARRSPEQRLAPEHKPPPEKVSSSSYARFWGSYSASEVSVSVSFSSLLDFDPRQWAAHQGELRPYELRGSLLPEEHNPALDQSDNLLELLGGRFGCFGDAMDRQWASKLNPKKDAADFAYQESAKFR